jgi:hypothetical protein
MAQLTYWSLKQPQYKAVPAVARARKALCKQMTGMFVNMWRLHGHVCENYLPHRNGTSVDGKVWANECTGTTFCELGGGNVGE